MTDDEETESTANDPRIDALNRASRTIDVAPLDAVHVVQVARARRRRNHTIISSALAAALIGAGVSVATTGSGPDPTSSVDATDHSQTPSPTVGCSGMTVASAETRGDDLLLSLRNSGTSDCNVRGLQLASQDTMRDVATADDVHPNDSLANGPLTPGNTVLIIAATDTCQAAGLPMEVTFRDASTLAFTFPGDLLACNQPGFGIDIRALNSVP